MHSKGTPPLLLVICCLFILVSCEGYDDTIEDNGYDIEDIYSRAAVVGTYQAEAHTFQMSCREQSNHGGFTGSGFMDFGGNGSIVEWNNIKAPVAGQYELTFRYANGSGGDRRCSVTVNDENVVVNVAFSRTGGWTTWKTVSITATLRAGINKISVTANTGAGGPNLDKMDLMTEEDIGGADTSLCVEAGENQSATLACPSGRVITQIDFASYGLPAGSCSAGFSTGTCHATNSTSKAQSLCLNRESCTVEANNGTFRDPCAGKPKKLAIVYSCETGSGNEDDPDDACPNTLVNGEKLYPGKHICSQNRAYEFGLTSGGELAIWSDSKKLWTSGVFGSSAHLIMQGDGNLVVYNPTKALWSSKTQGNGGATLKLENNGKVVIQLGTKELWSAGGEDDTDPGPITEGCVRPDDPTTSWQSSIVHCQDGRLKYESDAEGNRIPDFSYVGYKNGVELPNIPVVHTISPISGDNTAHIQNAINYVASQYRVKANGYRGTLLLNPGVYTTDNPIYLSHSGVVIRGSGNGNNPSKDTIIRSTRTGRDYMVLRMGKKDSSTIWNRAVSGSRVSISDSLIPIGKRSFKVTNANPFKVGDIVVIRQEVNDAWYVSVGNGGTVKDPGWSERDFPWMDISFTRTVTAISGRTITVDGPFFQRLDSNYGNLVVFNFDTSGTRSVLTNVGLENLRVFVETLKDVEVLEDSDPRNWNDLDHSEIAIDMVGIIDGWVRNVSLLQFSEDGIQISRSLRITIEDSTAGPPVGPIEGGRRYGYEASVGAQEILVRDCKAIKLRHGFVLNGSTRSSGVVFLRGELIDNLRSSEAGHRQWSMGVLFDNCYISSGDYVVAFLLGNRGDAGTSHGWAAANSVLWNTKTNGFGTIVAQKPPSAQNYAIGCSDVVNNSWWGGSGEWGFSEGTNEQRALYPPSLYGAQLADRSL